MRAAWLRWLWLPVLVGGLIVASKAEGQGPAFSGEKAWRHLVAQVDHGPRVPGTPAHAKTLAYLETELGRTGARVKVDRFSIQMDGKTYPMANVYADFGPEGPPVGMLAAHWDTRPRADHDRDPARRNQPIDGANDGASGVAVLLEAARVLGERPPAKTLRLAFWDGEDLGKTDETMFYGSRHYVRSGPLPRWGILLDMVGDRDLGIPKEAFSAHHASDLTGRIWRKARELGHGAIFLDYVSLPVNDDHLPFLEKGVPFVNLIDFDYPYWHTTEDTIDKCAPRSLEIVGGVTLAAARELLERP